MSIVSSNKKLNTINEEHKLQKIKLIKINNSKEKINTIPRNKRMVNKQKLPLIEEENTFLFNRINNCSPFYNINKWEKDFEKSQYYKMNLCQLPVINFQKFKKQNISGYGNKRRTLYKTNNNIKNSYLLSSCHSVKSYNHKYNFEKDENESNTDYISLYFFSNNKCFGDYPYIIVTSLDEYFSDVVQKLFNTIKNLDLDKEKINGYTCQDKGDFYLDLNKTIKDNGLKDKSEIIIQFK